MWWDSAGKAVGKNTIFFFYIVDEDINLYNPFGMQFVNMYIKLPIHRLFDLAILSLGIYTII